MRSLMRSSLLVSTLSVLIFSAAGRVSAEEFDLWCSTSNGLLRYARMQTIELPLGVDGL